MSDIYKETNQDDFIRRNIRIKPKEKKCNKFYINSDKKLYINYINFKFY